MCVAVRATHHHSLRPLKDYIHTDADHDDYYEEDDFTCFQTVRLPYEDMRPKVLHELSRGILLVTAERAVAAADDDGPAAGFFKIVDLLSQRWEGGVGLVLSFVHVANGAAWPRGDPTWKYGSMVSYQ